MGRGGRKGTGLATAVAVLAFLLNACGGGDEGSASHVNEDTGSTYGVLLDEREGTPPPPVEVANLKKAAERANCFLALDEEEESGKELPPGASSPTYATDPPTSGAYVEPPHQQADGAYRGMPRPVHSVGSINNGRLTIQYAPDLAEETQLALKGLYDTMYGGTLLFPNESMLLAIAATTWTNQLTCTGWEGPKTLDAIRAFGKATWGKHGHGSVDAFPVEGPTPAEPEVTARSD